MNQKTRNNTASQGFPSVLLMFSIATAVVCLPDNAGAQEWRFEPIMKVGAEIDDNASLNIRTDQEIELTGLLLDLKADIEYTSPTTSFVVQPRFLVREYSGDSQFNSDDLFLRSRFSRDGKSSSFGFGANFDQQSVRTGERAISDNDIDNPDEITDDDTGRVILTGDRNKWRLSPHWGYQLSDVSTISADLDYFDVEYDDEVSGTLFDYTDSRLNLNYRRAISDVTTLLFTATGRQYDSAATLGDISGAGVLGGIERHINENLRVTAMAGVENTDQSGASSDSEVVGNVTLTRDLNTIRMFARYKRSVTASGGGRLSIRDAISLNLRRRLSDKLSAGLGIRAYQADPIGGAATFSERHYVQLQSTFLWYLTTSFVIETSYRYTISDRSAAVGERSNSNQVNVWFVYQPRTVPRL